MKLPKYMGAAAALLAAGLLLTAGGCMLDKRHGFSGRIIAREDAYASLAFGAEPSAAPPHRQGERIFRGLAAHDFGLGPRFPARVDGAVLPFAVRVTDAVTVEPGRTSHRLRTDAGLVRLEPGEAFRLGGRAWTVEHLRPWVGITHVAQGRPRACVDLRLPGGTWLERLVLESGESLRISEELRLAFVWGPAENAADLLKEEEAAPRWGVQEGAATHWFESFTPGAGLTLRDGRELRLLSVERTEGAVTAIRVGIIDEDERYAVRIPANASVLDGLIRLEAPRSSESVLLLTSDRPYQASVRYERRGAVLARAELRAGAVWEPGAADWALRLVSVLAESIAVNAEDTPLWEVVLEGPSGERAVLREGQKHPEWPQLGVYERKTDPALRRLTLEVVREGAGAETLTLEPAGQALLEGWTLTQDLREPAPNGRYYLTAQRRGGRALLAAGGLFVFASLAVLTLPLLRPAIAPSRRTVPGAPPASP